MISFFSRCYCYRRAQSLSFTSYLDQLTQLKNMKGKIREEKNFLKIPMEVLWERTLQDEILVKKLFEFQRDQLDHPNYTALTELFEKQVEQLTKDTDRDERLKELSNITQIKEFTLQCLIENKDCWRTLLYAIVDCAFIRSCWIED